MFCVLLPLFCSPALCVVTVDLDAAISVCYLFGSAHFLNHVVFAFDNFFLCILIHAQFAC